MYYCRGNGLRLLEVNDYFRSLHAHQRNYFYLHSTRRAGCLLYHHFELGLNYRDIATKIKTPYQTVKANVRYAMSKIEDEVKFYADQNKEKSLPASLDQSISYNPLPLDTFRRRGPQCSPFSA